MEALIMLNELKLIIDGLEAVECTLAPMHKDLTQPGGKDAVRVILDKKDKKVFIRDLLYVTSEQIEDIWILKKSNHDHFPKIKLTRPLRPMGNELASLLYIFFTDKKKKESSASRLTVLCQRLELDFDWIKNQGGFTNELSQHLLSKSPQERSFDITTWPKSAYRNKILSRLTDLNSQSSVSKTEKINDVIELYQRYSMFGNNGIDFLFMLDEQISKKIEHGITNDKFLLLLMNIIFGLQLCKNNGDLPDGKRPEIILDYIPNEESGIFVSSSKQYKKSINNYLLGQEQTKNMVGLGTCPITGEFNNLVNDKFPDINLGKGLPVSQIKPYAKFDAGGERETVHRYHHAGIESFSVDTIFSQKIEPALKLLTNEKNKGKTWGKVASGKKASDLLLAFCHSNLNACVAKALSIDDFDEYIDNTSDILHLLEGKKIQPSSLIDIILLRKVDDGNQKIIYSSRQTVQKFANAASQWTLAIQNTPKIKLPVLIEKKKRLVAPYAISPNTMVFLSNKRYEKNGHEVKGNVSGISFEQVMHIFFEEGNSFNSLLLHVIKKFCQQSIKLFEFCVMKKNDNKYSKDITNGNNQVLKFVTILSVLLFKLDRKKEDYMSDFSYQLGQLCSAMNELHIGYCAKVRDGNIPTKLIGSAAYSMALKSPLRALDFLACRITPYIMWVKKQEPEKDKEGKWKFHELNNAIFAHNWIHKNSEKIYQAFLQNPTRHLSKTHTAELMLGYLAGRDFKES